MASEKEHNYLSANIKAICDHLGISESQFMNSCDIDRSCLTRLKQGKTSWFSTENMHKLGIFTHLLSDELLFDKPSDILRKFIERKDLAPRNYAHLYALIAG